MIELWEDGSTYIRSIATSMIPPKGSLMYVDGSCWQVTGVPEFIMFRDQLAAKVPVKLKMFSRR